MTHIMAALDVGFSMGVAQENARREEEKFRKKTPTHTEKEESCKLVLTIVLT